MLKNFGIITRNLRVDDIDHVYKLGRSIFVWPTECVFWKEEMLRWYHEQSKEICFVAEKESVIIGFILCFSIEATGRVEWVAVDSMFQKQGIATELLRRALSVLKLNKITHISASAREDGKANSFFIQNGFQDSGLRKIEMSLYTPSSVKI